MRGSVLVVGGGIAGMRAAAELIQQKFKVYLLEERSFVGGKMAIIDRIYPTNEHSACALRPLTQALLESPDVTVLTSTELLSLQGGPGDFKVKVLKKPGRGSPQEMDLAVGAVILAIGLDEARGESLSRFGYGQFPNVLTGLEFGWQLSGLGPTGGVVRLPDGKEPRRVAWIVRGEDSPVSFMSASAQAWSYLEKNKDAHATIIFEKRSTRGKGYDEYCQDAEQHGVHYIQASSLEIGETRTGDLNLSYSGVDGATAALEADMLVLSTPLVPSDKNRALAEMLGLEHDQDGFPRREAGNGHPILTFREGVFVCGGAQGSKGIGESVIQACAAAARAAALLAAGRATELAESVEKKLYPVKASDEPRIAVVIDRGGSDVAGVLEMDELAEYTRALPGVIRVEVTPSASCGSKIAELLGTGDFNRLIVAGPSPITHEPVFQRHAETGGLNRYLLEMVNLHNQCARVHSQDRTEATQKARILMKVGVVRARQLEPLEPLKVRVTQGCLIVGASVSGIACASTLADMGLKVHLLERETDLGSVPGNDHSLVRPLLARLRANKNVAIHSPALVARVQGRVGNFMVELTREGQKESLEVGAVVLASKTGFEDTSDGTGFAASLQLEKDEHGLYVSTQGILNPLDFTTDGVFNCGPARAVLDVEDAVLDGVAAASRVACILSSNVMVRSPVISWVVNENCDGCGYCVDPCPTRSITLLEFMRNDTIKKVVEVSEVTCIGCGVCMSTCPKEGAFVRHFKSTHFSEMVKAALEDAGEGDEHKPVIVCFCCNRCAYPAADAAGLAGIHYPAGVRIIRTVCAGMIHPNIITDALTRGADGVLLCGCHTGECRSREGIRKAQARAESIGLLMEDFGLEEERFRLESIAASEGPKFARVAREMAEELCALGPSPYR